MAEIVRRGVDYAVLRQSDGTFTLIVDDVPGEILKTINTIAEVEELSMRVVILDWLERRIEPRRPLEWPTRAMFVACVRAADLAIDAECLWDCYEMIGWVSHKGEPIRDWLAAARAWAYIVSGMCQKDFDDLEPDDFRNCGRGYGNCRRADQGGAEGTAGPAGGGSGAQGPDPEIVSGC